LPEQKESTTRAPESRLFPKKEEQGGLGVGDKKETPLPASQGGEGTEKKKDFQLWDSVHKRRHVLERYGFGMGRRKKTTNFDQGKVEKKRTFQGERNGAIKP